VYYNQILSIISEVFANVFLLLVDIPRVFFPNRVISHFDMFFQISSVKNVYNIGQWKCALYVNGQVAKVKNSSRKFVGVLYSEISWVGILGVVNRLKAGQPSHHSFSGSGKRFFTSSKHPDQLCCPPLGTWSLSSC